MNSSIRSCRIDTGWADRVASDRFLNPNLVLAPSWSGFDTAGRPAHQDSVNTKTAGGNSPLDRVFVENYLRPKYVEYVNLSAGGIEGAIYGDNRPNTVLGRDTHRAIYDVTGNFNNDYNSDIRPRCGIYPYQAALNSTGVDPPIGMGYPTAADIYSNNAYANRQNQANGIATAISEYKTIAGAYSF